MCLGFQNWRDTCCINSRLTYLCQNTGVFEDSKRDRQLCRSVIDTKLVHSRVCKRIQDRQKQLDIIKTITVDLIFHDFSPAFVKPSLTCHRENDIKWKHLRHSCMLKVYGMLWIHIPHTFHPWLMRHENIRQNFEHAAKSASILTH